MVAQHCSSTGTGFPKFGANCWVIYNATRCGIACFHVFALKLHYLRFSHIYTTIFVIEFYHFSLLRSIIKVISSTDARLRSTYDRILAENCTEKGVYPNFGCRNLTHSDRFVLEKYKNWSHYAGGGGDSQFSRLNWSRFTQVPVLSAEDLPGFPSYRPEM